MIAKHACFRSFAIAGLIFGLSASVSQAADFNWKCQSFWQPGTTNQQAFEQFAADVKDKSGGRIEIEALGVGTLVPPGEMLDAMGAGIIDCMNGGTGYFVGKDPAFALLADFNAGYESPEQLTGWFWEGGGVEIAQEIYGNFDTHYLGPVMWGAESIPSKEPLRSVSDFNGIKMRSPEGMGAAIWRLVGVGVSTLPGTEVYTALERGKIEATDWGTLGMNDELGYDKIAPYAIYPGIHSMPMSDISVNQANWDQLPDDLKTVLENAAKAFNENSLRMNAELDQAMVDKREPDTLINWGTDERRELREIAKGVWAEWAEKSPLAKKVYESHIAYMTKIGLL